MHNLKGQLEVFRQNEVATPAERETAGRMVRYLDEHGEAGFYRTHRPAHFTASALVLSPDGKKVLLMWHKKLQKWLQPGGHADGDVDLRRVAAREVQEETGVEVDDERVGVYVVDWHPIPTTPKEDAHEHADVAYLFRARAWDLVRQVEEADDVRWFTPAEALAVVDDGSVRRMIGRLPAEVSPNGR